MGKATREKIGKRWGKDSAGHLGRKGSKGYREAAWGDGKARRVEAVGRRGSSGKNSKWARGRRAAKARSVRRWTRAGGPTSGPVHSGAGMSAEPNGVGADLVEGTVDVSQPVGKDGVRVTEDVTPEVEGE